MEDILIRVSNDTWHMDVSISKGWFNSVPTGQTAKQRASVSSLMVRGSVPADTTMGVDWLGYLDDSLPLTILDSQIRQNIQANVATGLIQTTVQPIILSDSDRRTSVALTTLGGS